MDKEDSFVRSPHLLAKKHSSVRRILFRRSYRVDGIPSHCSSLLRVHAVLSRFVQDRDAHVTIRVNIWMPDVRSKFHLRRSVGVCLRELELAIENTSFTVLEENVNQSTAQPETLVNEHVKPQPTKIGTASWHLSQNVVRMATGK